MAKLNTELANMTKEAVFVTAKSAELLLTMVAEQAATSARKSKRKSITGNDLASVFYGARSADLIKTPSAFGP